MRITESYLASKYNLSESYFSALKKNNREKYDLIFSFDENKETSLNKYMDYLSELIEKMGKILNSFEIKSDYGRKLFKLGLRGPKNFASTFDAEEKAVFRIRESKDYLRIKLELIRKWEIIVKEIV